MKKQAFSSEKYLNLQRDHILERINQFDGKLYLEFGGKMLEDFHAARVLPGYEPDNKIKLLQEFTSLHSLHWNKSLQRDVDANLPLKA